MDKQYKPQLIEEKWRAFWEPFHRPKEGASPFTILLPPPNVTGVLHMGHTLATTLQDILIRKKRMEGFSSLFLPGTDHAGIATQSVVEEQLYKKTGKKRDALSREEFLKAIWDFKEEKQHTILSQLRQIGASLDWSRLRFTLDDESSKAVAFCFKTLFDDGHIYRGDYLVNWDTQLQTALSDDEVEYEERASHLWYFRYPLEDHSDHIIIATTRPETLLGDVAVAVHPDDARFQSLIGKKIALPFTGRKIPIIADTYVDPDFGSGCVKITPAHDENDYLVGQRHNLPMINIMTKSGKILKDWPPFAGLSMQEARKKMACLMEEKGLLEKKEPYTLRVGVSYRSKAVIEPYLSKQWFIRMKAFKEILSQAVKTGEVKIFPKKMEQTYFHWIDNLRDWCISRQLVWGHHIPVWTANNDPNTFVCSDGTSPPPEVTKNPENWTRDKDVLDTWFSSALWPLSTLGWPDKTQDLAHFYPTSVLVTGHDILFFWVARMIMMGKYFTGKAPFSEVFIHGLIYGKSYWREEKGMPLYVSSEERIRYDEDPASIPQDVRQKWEKMSKSKGNVIDPISVIEDYGTDAMRLSLVTSLTSLGQIDLDRRSFEEQRNFINKIWNSARFVLMSTEDLKITSGLEPKLLTVEDHWILRHLDATIQKTSEHLAQYAFEKAVSVLYDFYWKMFCSIYLETTKPYLREENASKLREQKQKLLLLLLSCLMRLFHPFIPFITEEIFQILKKQFPIEPLPTEDLYLSDLAISFQQEACIIAPYPTPFSPAFLDPKALQTMELLQNIVYHIRNIRGDMQIPLGEKVAIYLHLKEEPLTQEMQQMLFSLTRIASIHEKLPEKKGFGSSVETSAMYLFIPLPKHLREKELLRIKKAQEKTYLMKERIEKKLQNRKFRENAPQNIVQEQENQLKDCLISLQELEKKRQQIE